MTENLFLCTKMLYAASLMCLNNKCYHLLYYECIVFVISLLQTKITTIYIAANTKKLALFHQECHYVLPNYISILP